MDQKELKKVLAGFCVAGLISGSTAVLPLSASLAVVEATKKRGQVVPRAAEVVKNRRQLAPKVAEAATRMVQVAPKHCPGKKPKNTNPKVAEAGTRMVQVAPHQTPGKRPKSTNPKVAEVSSFHAVRMICTARSMGWISNEKTDD